MLLVFHENMALDKVHLDWRKALFGNSVVKDLLRGSQAQCSCLNLPGKDEGGIFEVPCIVDKKCDYQSGFGP